MGLSSYLATFFFSFKICHILDQSGMNMSHSKKADMFGNKVHNKTTWGVHQALQRQQPLPKNLLQIAATRADVSAFLVFGAVFSQFWLKFQICNPFLNQ